MLRYIISDYAVISLLLDHYSFAVVMIINHRLHKYLCMLHPSDDPSDVYFL
jgi:hypothetical protein